MKKIVRTALLQLGILFIIAFVLTLLFSFTTVTLLAAVTVSIILSVSLMVVGHAGFWLCKWKRLKWILGGIACIIALSVVGLVEENIRTSYKWNAHKAALEKKGEHFNLSHFIPPAIPDDQNFTMTPLLKPIMEFKQGRTNTVWLDTNALSKVAGVRSELAMKGVENNTKAGSMERGTFADLKTYQEFYKGNTNYCQPAAPGPASEDILIALSKFDSELNELKEAMKTRPLANWGVRFDNTNSVFGILLPHLGHIKGLVVFCQIHGIAAADAGLSQVAFEDFMVSLRLADSVKNSPILIDHLVRAATLNITMQGLREGLYRHTWTAEQLLELEKQLAAIDLLPEAKISLRGERAMNVMGIEQLRTGAVTLHEIGLENHVRKLPRLVSCAFYQNMVTISTLHQDMIDTSIDEKRHLVFTNTSPKMREFQKQCRNPYNALAWLLMPAYEKFVIRTAKTQTMVEAARMACALERHRLQHGSFPETLTDPPSDVMNGKPLQYRKTSDGGYILYSVGWNGVDDGGVTGFKKNRETGKPSPDAETGDWVWIMPLK
jgi:hypothetical protein